MSKFRWVPEMGNVFPGGEFWECWKNGHYVGAVWHTNKITCRNWDADVKGDFKSINEAGKKLEELNEDNS